MYDLTIYTDEELKKIQNLELECLKAIINVCNEINVEYFLIGGTALGAIRHNGFIPWDDDIDIGMTRENYTKFLNEAQQLFPKGYYLQSPYNDKKNPYYYSKVRIDGTEFVEYCNHRINMHHGVYIDIFPFDEVPDDEEKNIIQFNKVQKLIRKFSLRQSPDVAQEPHSITERIKAIIRIFIHKIYKLSSYKKITDNLEKTITQYNGTGQKAIASLNFPKRKKLYILKEDLYPLIDYQFEDIKAKIPNNYDRYLKTHYGNYMELPPQNERFGHKPYKVNLG